MTTSKFVTNLRHFHSPHTNLTEFVAFIIDGDHDLNLQSIQTFHTTNPMMQSHVSLGWVTGFKEHNHNVQLYKHVFKRLKNKLLKLLIFCILFHPYKYKVFKIIYMLFISSRCEWLVDSQRKEGIHLNKFGTWTTPGKPTASRRHAWAWQDVDTF